MALPWVRLDTGLPDHPKILSLLAGKKARAALMYVFGLSYSGRHETDGFIPQAALPFIHGSKSDALALGDVGLGPARPGGWEVNDWSSYQPSREEPARRKESARNAALKRWHDTA